MLTPENDPTTDLVTIIASAITAIAVAVQIWLRKKSPSARVAEHKAEQEVSLVEQLTEENKALRQELRQAYTDQRELGRLTERVAILTRAVGENIEIAKETKQEAKAAHIEANDMNKKIESIGLKLVDEPWDGKERRGSKPR